MASYFARSNKLLLVWNSCQSTRLLHRRLMGVSFMHTHSPLSFQRRHFSNKKGDDDDDIKDDDISKGKKNPVDELKEALLGSDTVLKSLSDELLSTSPERKSPSFKKKKKDQKKAAPAGEDELETKRVPKEPKKGKKDIKTAAFIDEPLDDLAEIRGFLDQSFGAERFSGPDDKQVLDPFGLEFDDGKEGLGPQLPPSFKRDDVTGRFTGEVEVELSNHDKKALSADPIERDHLILEDIEKHWQKSGTDIDGRPKELNQLGARVRHTQMATNVIGRSVQAQAAAEELDDGSELGRDETHFSQNLSKEEFNTFQEYMGSKHKVDVTDDDMPVHENKSERTRKASAVYEDLDRSDLALKWLTARAKRQMDTGAEDNPYSELMPGDLSPSRLVNRKQAKPIPIQLLHHNNVQLLQNFITPTGQIRSRIQTRLGARDQRRVAKLIKRARALGMIPYMGQFKVENHGWKNDPDIHKDREWEKQLKERGLTILRRETPSNPSMEQASQQTAE